MNASELTKRAAIRAQIKWPYPFEGGNHLMRYVTAEVQAALNEWKVTPDLIQHPVRLCRADAVEIIKIAGALHRFMEQVGPDEILRVSGMEDRILLMGQFANIVEEASGESNASDDASGG